MMFEYVCSIPYTKQKNSQKKREVHKFIEVIKGTEGGKTKKNILKRQGRKEEERRHTHGLRIGLREKKKR